MVPDLTEESCSSQERALAHYKVVNRVLETISIETDFSKAVNSMLALIGKELQADRCYVFSLDEKCMLCDNTHEWTSEPKLAEIENLHHVSLKDHPEWIQQLKKQSMVVINDLDNPPENLRDSAAFLKKQHIKSIFVIGMKSEEKLTGFLGVDFVHHCHTFSDSSLQMLQDASKLYGIALAREQRLAVIRQQNKELCLAMEEAKSAIRAKSEFLATMSHELRTPLNSVIGFSELLGNAELPVEEQRKYAQNINVAGRALLSLINDLLDLSKLEAEQMPIQPEPFSVETLFDELNAIFTQSALSRGLILQFSGAENVPPLLFDGLRLKQIMLNLIGNALKFTPKGSVLVQAAFSAGSLKLSVSDTGIGIPKEQQQHIFDPFYQGRSPRETRLQGTGLGLAISRKLVERMSGMITLDSQKGKGSCFLLQFENVSILKDASCLDHLAGESTITALPPKKLLLVDDVKLNLRLLEALCSHLGMTTKSADSGTEALELLKQEKFDAVLTDLWMPDINGGELAAKIHADPHFAKLPIAVVTADSEPEELFPTSDFIGILTKPITLQQLIQLLTKI